MTASLAVTAPAPSPELLRRHPARWWWLPAGLLAGLTLGAVARGWMRLLTDDPEFSWSGTIFIVGAFGIAGAGVTLAATARQAGWRRRVTTPIRVIATVLVLPIFGGAGIVMLPTSALGAFAAWRPMRSLIRIALSVVAAIPALLVAIGAAREAGLSVRTGLGVVLFAATYVAVIAALWSIVAPIDDDWRVPRRVRGPVLIALALVVVVVVVLMTTGI